MAEKIVPEHEPLNLERSRGDSSREPFFRIRLDLPGSPAFPDGILLLAADQVLFGPHPLDPGASFLELKILLISGGFLNLGVLGFSFFQAF